MSSLMTYLGQVANVCYQRDIGAVTPGPTASRFDISTTSDEVFRFKFFLLRFFLFRLCLVTRVCIIQTLEFFVNAFKGCSNTFVIHHCHPLV
nr:MAG TPA_asm: hypothetical protein [Caudoviricetes sp.]